MFTGLVSAMGYVRAIKDGPVRRMTIEAPYPAQDLVLGASISHDGACLTLVDIQPEEAGVIYAVDVSPETLDRTTLGSWTKGRTVNLERALKANDELGGHIVQGHVDGVGRVQSIDNQDGWLQISIEAPIALARFIAEKGSIAVNGVSLTVNGVDEARFELMIIPHTAQVTTLGQLQPGDSVNLEVDIMARYAARLTEFPDTMDT